MKKLINLGIQNIKKKKEIKVTPVNHKEIF